jgi:cytochrome c oxidase subunit II
MACVVPALAGCSGALSTLEPAGPAAGAIASLWWAMLIGSAAIFALVMTLLAIAFWRRTPARVSERTWLVGGGLAFPLVVLGALLAFALVIGERLLPKGGDVPMIEAVASQWQWTFRHPGERGGIVHTGVLHIPAGRPVDVHISATDVIHSFWVPRLAGKLDAIPGKVNIARIEAAAPGTYAAQCAEYCGTGHTQMRFTVIALDPAAWAAFIGKPQ